MSHGAVASLAMAPMPCLGRQYFTIPVVAASVPSGSGGTPAASRASSSGRVGRCMSVWPTLAFSCEPPLMSRGEAAFESALVCCNARRVAGARAPKNSRYCTPGPHGRGTSKRVPIQSAIAPWRRGISRTGGD